MMPARIIVVGASAGGVEAVMSLLRDLPASLNASVFVVIHIPSHGPSLLPQIFGRHSALTVIHAEHMQPIEVGKVYIAPPDYHLLINNQHIELTKGAKVNNSRPSIDNLFISAALGNARHLIGIVLTGLLDDGSVGLAKIKRFGGIAIVQDPSEALFPQMPLNAIEATECDYILPIAQISKLLIQLSEEPVTSVATMDEHNNDKPKNRQNFYPPDLFNHGENIYQRGKASVYSCPDCGGVLAEIKEDGSLRYVCRVGHAYSPDWLLAVQRESIEKALWTALRALDESMSLARNMAEVQSDDELKQEYLEKADEYEKQANVLRNLIYN